LVSSVPLKRPKASRASSNRCKVGLDAKESRQPNLFLPFPGLGNDNPFRCNFELDPYARKPIPRTDIARITGITSTPKAVVEAVELFAAQAQAIAEAPAAPHVILCALPAELITRVVHEIVIPDRDQGDEEHDDDTTRYDFHDLLKAKTNHLKCPLQLLWPTTWDETAKVVRTLERLSGRRVQDPATRAWNLFNLLGQIPRSLLRLFQGCYCRCYERLSA
jgi:hypothetical protein